MSEEEKKELKHIERFIRSMGLLKEANLILKTQKELDKKDKVINNLYADIEYEYSGTNYLKSLEDYYKEVEEKDE